MESLASMCPCRKAGVGWVCGGGGGWECELGEVRE